ncbi:MAG: hypothetical protein WBE82_17695 [Xanthobacteraceae bacterium]
MSIGVASGLPTANIDKIIQRADAVLSTAKEHGRNRVEADETLVVPEAHADGARKPAKYAPAAAKAGPVPAAVTVPIMVR